VGKEKGIKEGGEERETGEWRGRRRKRD